VTFGRLLCVNISLLYFKDLVGVATFLAYRSQIRVSLSIAV
jgi:hypothetical protein